MRTLFKAPIVALMVLGLMAISAPSFASVGVKLNGVDYGQATDLNFVCGSGTNRVLSPDGSMVNVNCSPNLATTGTGNSGAVSMATTDLTVSTSYAFVRKAIAAAANPGFSLGTLANGIPGQVLTIFITTVGSSGNWRVTPTTATGFTAVQFSIAGQSATFMYINDTIGWILQGYAGSTLPVIVGPSP